MTDHICAAKSQTGVPFGVQNAMWWQNAQCGTGAVDITGALSPQVVANVKRLRGQSIQIPPDILAQINAALGKLPGPNDIPVAPSGSTTNPGGYVGDAANEVINAGKSLTSSTGDFIKLITNTTVLKGVFLLLLAGTLLTVGVKLLK